VTDDTTDDIADADDADDAVVGIKQLHCQ